MVDLDVHDAAVINIRRQIAEGNVKVIRAKMLNGGLNGICLALPSLLIVVPRRFHLAHLSAVSLNVKHHASPGVVRMLFLERVLHREIKGAYLHRFAEFQALGLKQEIAFGAHDADIKNDNADVDDVAAVSPLVSHYEAR